MKLLSHVARLTLLVTACIYPTDKGNDLHIEVAPIARMIRGDSFPLEAKLLDSNDSLVPNARFTYESAKTSVAIVTLDGMVIAVNADTTATTTITVRALGTEGTPPETVTVAVSATVSVDSLRPTLVKWGQELSIYGTGLAPESGQVVRIDEVPVSVSSYHPDDAARPERFGVLGVVIAPPLQTGGGERFVSAVVVTSHGAARRLSPLTVESGGDVYEPNTLTPTDLGNIAGVREFPGLAMEGATVGPKDIDWYRFTTTAVGNWTVQLRVPAGQEAFPPRAPTFNPFQLSVFPADSIEAETLVGHQTSYYPTYIAYYPRRGSSAGGIVLCRGRGAWFTYPSVGGQPERTVPLTFQSANPTALSIRNVPAGQHDLMVTWFGLGLIGADPGNLLYSNRRANQWAAIFEGASALTAPVRYDLVFTPELPGETIAGDSYEPNDFCEDARRPILTLGPAPFADSVDLTFDGAADHDWFRVEVQTAGVLHARYSPDSTPSNINLFGALVTSDPDSAVVVGSFGLRWSCGVSVPWLTSFGSDGCVMEGASVQPGSYYLFVNRVPSTAAAYKLMFSWAPGALSARTGLGDDRP